MRSVTVPSMEPRRRARYAALAAKVGVPCAVVAVTFATLAPAAAGRSAQPASELVTRAAGVPVTSQGVALTGADALKRGGRDGSGVRVVVLDQAFGAASRLDALAGVDLPPLERQHRLSFDQTYGLAGRDYNANSSRHGEFVAEIVYDLAPGAEYWFVNYHSTAEFGQAADWIANELKPEIVVHSNSFLFGPFDGTGYFAQKVDAAAAAGTLWVNSVGNYRTRHWEGAWSDADADGSLDVPGDGNAFRVQLEQTARPACDLSWSAPDPSGASRYAMQLYADPAFSTPLLDAHTALPLEGAFEPLPTPHVHLPPGFLAAAGIAYLRVTRIGAPAGDHLTLFCRFDLSATAQVVSSSAPTPGDAKGALAVGAYDATKLTFESYSSQGPTDDGRLKPDLAAPTNVAITGDTRCGGTSCATPHAAGAAALIWSEVAAAPGPGTVAERVRARLTGQALDLGDAGPDQLFGNGGLRLDLTPPALGETAPRSGAAVRGDVQVELPLVEAGTLLAPLLDLDGTPLPAVFDGSALRTTLATRALADGAHVLRVSARDLSGNAAVLSLPLLVDNAAPRLRATISRPAGLRLARVRLSVQDDTSHLAGRPRIRFGDGATAVGFRALHRYRLAGRYRVVCSVVDQAGNPRSVATYVRVR